MANLGVAAVLTFILASGCNQLVRIGNGPDLPSTGYVQEMLNSHGIGPVAATFAGVTAVIWLALTYSQKK